MSDIKPFRCVRPDAKVASRVAALPYDVYNRAEAKVVALRDPLSFLNIDRAESNLPDDVDTYDDRVYAKAKELLCARIADGTYVSDETECYYIYELIMDGRSQKGIVACASIDDYVNGVIKKHENTRADKEQDRIRHVDTCSAQTGPIFLAYRARKELSELINSVMKNEKLYGFTSDDGITHNVWRISDKSEIDTIRRNFEETESIYIADGHHRAASAVKVGLKRRAENPGYTGKEEFNYFLSVLFAEDELMIMDYNRVLKDLNGNTVSEFMDKVSACFDVSEVGKGDAKEESANFRPAKKGEFGMLLNGTWYRLNIKDGMYDAADPVASLDVSILQDKLLGPVLGIKDPKTDKRIDFVGGIRGLKELARRCESDMELAFSMYPTSITELFAVADAGLLMPPKSTWFEPKLRSGLFIHRI
ncbi:MAG: DUF1015 domain-containing protein [Lachnospiraceae bacterium]|nr:DUF1015 domain-containing protein [Lachnospiraceae bacterium]